MDIRSSYDAVATEYVERILNELEGKPFDRAWLDRFADEVRGHGPVCDLGCGPGHVARYLQGRGVDVFGVDLSPRMVEEARRLNPGIEFRSGDMLALEMADGVLAGIAALYSIIHIPRDAVVRALRELSRVLRPGGVLLIAFHLGDQVVHLEDWWGKKVSLDFVFFHADEMRRFLGLAGFDVEEVVERDPYPGVEHQSRRAYVRARKPIREAASTG